MLRGLSCVRRFIGGIQLEQTSDNHNELPLAENPSPNGGRPILDITSGISTLQAVITQVQTMIRHFTDLEDILCQLSQSRSLKRDREAQMSHIEEIVEHINAMDRQHTAEGHSIFGKTEDAPVVSLPDGSSVNLRPNPILPSLNNIECQSHKDISAYLEDMKAQLQDVHSWQSYLVTQLDALTGKLPHWGDNALATDQDGAPTDAVATAQEITATLVDRLLTRDVLSLTHMGQLKSDRAAALLEDPTIAHPTPCHLAVHINALNIH